MSDQFLGEIRIFPGGFNPRGWAFCNGQLLSIAQNTALFSIIGTAFGGDGKSTFGLPNLQGSVPLGQGQGPGLSNYVVGDAGGSASVTLTVSTMPSHSHHFNADSAAKKELSNVLDAFPAGSESGSFYSTATPNVTMNAQMLQPAGGTGGTTLPHNNVQPYLAVNFCIATTGMFPTRN